RGPEVVEEPAVQAGPALPRLGAAPAPATAAGRATGSAPKKKKKKRKKADRGDALDKRVLGAIGAVGVGVLAFLGLLRYEAFIKPPTIVGTWAGSMIEFETGRPMIRTEYRLLLDEKKRASLTLQDKFTSVGTYTFKGDRLKLTLKGKEEDGEEGLTSEQE